MNAAPSRRSSATAVTWPGKPTDAAELALAAARKIADSALEHFPEAPVRAALEALSNEVRGHPRLLVRTPERILERVQAVLDQTAEAVGFPGQVTAVADPRLEGAAFVFEWGEGRRRR